jgi:hypothetical protein
MAISTAQIVIANARSVDVEEIVDSVVGRRGSFYSEEYINDVWLYLENMNWQDVDEIDAALVRAGFDVIEVKDIS